MLAPASPAGAGAAVDCLQTHPHKMIFTIYPYCITAILSDSVDASAPQHYQGRRVVPKAVVLGIAWCTGPQGPIEQCIFAYRCARYRYVSRTHGYLIE